MKTKKYRWNWRKCLGNLTAVTVIMATSLLLGYIFAMWMGGAA